MGLKARLAPLFSFATRMRRAYARAMLRGQRHMRKQGRLPLISQTKTAISQTRLPAFTGSARAYIFHDALAQSELIIRQYLMIRVAGPGLHRSILAAFGGWRWPVHILPPHILSLLDEMGIPVAHRLSRLAWYGYVFAIWAYGCVTILKLAVTQRPGRARLHTPRTTALFVRILQGNLPPNRAKTDRYDLLSWYEAWPDRNPKITTLAPTGALTPHSLSDGPDIQVMPSEFTALPNWQAWLAFVGWACLAIPYSLFDLIRGRWWHGLLLNEAAKAHITALTPPEDLAAEYWFSHTGYIYRPIWSYGAEARGARLFLYFYSVNNSAIQKAGEADVAIGAWPLMNWPTYVVWDDKQAAFIRKALSYSPQIHIIGDLPFVDSAADMPKLSGRTLALFDIHPFRPFLHALQAQVFEYYNPTCAVDLLEDIAEICAELDMKMVWKRKREVQKLAHPRYRRAELALAQKTETVVSIDPQISAHRVIKSCDMAINVPFTSTALIARNMGKPSCYYDASGLLDPDDPAAHGIPILLTKTQLKAWILTQLSQ